MHFDLLLCPFGTYRMLKNPLLPPKQPFWSPRRLNTSVTFWLTRSLLSAAFRVNRHYQSRVKFTLSCSYYVTGISKRPYKYHIGPDIVRFGRFGAISELLSTSSTSHPSLSELLAFSALPSGSLKWCPRRIGRKPNRQTFYILTF